MNLQRIPELETARTYGIIGIILDFLGSVLSIVTRGFGLIIDIIGLIFILLAVKTISDYYNDQRPFRYMVYSIISAVIIAVVAIILILALVIPANASISTHLNGYQISAAAPVFSAISFLFLLLIIIVVAALIPTVFEYLAFNTIGDLTGIDQFRTGAILLIIGIILTIIVIGAIISLVGIILIAIGFNDLPLRARPRVIDENINPGNGFN
ncbi:DUF996 domain-containing protein [Picrophilus oshimae]|uniref:Membrane spanning protein n=1 Tax=Picrophilus torridus (strain ATCC 700027 / DSM 9790 / JCM 10055 / NBRC 100828 / KAW 2/3) TaxID=1122961 RepID=Q6KZ07_PICTO|nr:DUF996 domain-containing protein [Picrophilus oshimae]AAT44045.1 membrane spanning protein [Picrophilus oshimae DSM 9789]SMD30884.1 Uncharacterized membrane protein [Picrophilus oshimae DSM 9789]